MKEWQQFLSRLEQELGSDVVQKWMPTVIRFDAANLYLKARDSFQVNWFEEHVRPKIKGLLNNNDRPIKIHLETEKTPSPEKEGPKGGLSFSQTPLDPEMTLENFLAAGKNIVPHKLLTEDSPFNPIYLYGVEGSGKTHLLMGAAHELKKQGKKVLFVKAETFTEHVVQAIRLGQMIEFRKIYRDIDVLIIDDIHIFSRKTATQEEFFHTFNTLHTTGRLIILSANVPPMRLSEIEPRLISRFEWGISLGLEKGDVESIIIKKAELWKIPLSEELKEYLLKNFPKNPIMALQALALRAKGAEVSCVAAEAILKDLLAKEKEKAITSEHIVKAVANHYGITSVDLLGKSQMREYALPRQVAMYFCREQLKWPFQKIGELFGRDHSTVMSSVKQIQKAIDEKKIEAIGEIASNLN
ncbi:MAG: chromosomal replication initiation protein [Chlamydiae bacterium CG10_big_fil_rev_8_21_14_0_10_42_34]|nr:MAG: chromosomal replication initiation protein [Chlamydiae bacterium CG10_big_fil_rev_8_21_14_0_10_42_34]